MFVCAINAHAVLVAKELRYVKCHEITCECHTLNLPPEEYETVGNTPTYCKVFSGVCRCWTGGRDVIQEQTQLNILGANALPALSRTHCEDQCSLCSLDALLSIVGTGLLVTSFFGGGIILILAIKLAWWVSVN